MTDATSELTASFRTGVVRHVNAPTRPDEFRGHAAGEIDDLVVPEIAIEAAVGRRMRIAILQRQNFGNLRQSLMGKEFAAHRKGGRLILTIYTPAA